MSPYLRTGPLYYRILLLRTEGARGYPRRKILPVRVPCEYFKTPSPVLGTSRVRSCGPKPITMTAVGRTIDTNADMSRNTTGPPSPVHDFTYFAFFHAYLIIFFVHISLSFAPITSEP
jgi:hypothetical protein